MIGNYLLQIFIGIDQVINTWLGGWADETISARCYREDRKYLMKFINCLFFWQKEHCRDAYYSEVLRKQYPEEYQDIYSGKK